MVITTFDLQPFRIYPKGNKRKNQNDKPQPQLLTTNIELRKAYQQKLDEKLGETENENWDKIAEKILQAAKETIGGNSGEREHQTTTENEITMLSKKQKNLRIEIENTKNETKRAEKKRERNKILKEIRRKLSEKVEKQLDDIADEIETTGHSYQMFKAVKKIYRKKPEKIILKDEAGKSITNPKEVQNAITKFYKERLVDEQQDEVKLEMRSLEEPITTQEVKKSIKNLKNGKTPGYDKINAEMVKYGTEKLTECIRDILNDTVQGNTRADIGRGIIKPLQKPGKPKGILKNLRPITLLPIVRKILSNIATTRIKEKTEKFISPSQSAYRSNRSTTDIVWAYKWIIAKIQKQQTEVFVTGIDMTAAFDTIERKKLIEIYEKIASKDDVQMMTALISNTTLEIEIPGANTKEQFTSNIGSPQGDGASGGHFTTYFENALQNVRSITREDHTYQISSPIEMQYADDADFNTKTEEEQKELATMIPTILAEQNLKVNPEKTEFIHLKRSKITEEHWRKVKKLGSLLGDSEDVIHRKNLATNALAKLKELWKRSQRIHLAKKLRIYNALVKSILLYNCETWGLTKANRKQLDALATIEESH
jgi:hypothetical protein